MARVLVTGGAGYIGSHLVRLLAESGHDPVVLDDLSTGHREAVGGVRLVQADFADRAALDGLLSHGRIDCIVHLAASSEVGASISDPAVYYKNNITRGLTLLNAAVRHGVRGIVFSSSAAVYGEPQAVPIEETHPKLPTNPYGETKLALERALGWYHEAYGLRFASLRYFNAAGAHPDGNLGEDHAEETHLIPRLLMAACGDQNPVPLFGEDYPTRDGTCVRDFIHVVDLAHAHLAAIAAIAAEGDNPGAFNLGNERGFTVKEVIRQAEEVTGRRIPVKASPRRPGDPAVLVASATRAGRELGWRPRHGSLHEIVESAWRWHRRFPGGFADFKRPAILGLGFGDRLEAVAADSRP
jgi:UDP-glucose 4-epimerase